MIQYKIYYLYLDFIKITANKEYSCWSTIRIRKLLTPYAASVTRAEILRLLIIFYVIFELHMNSEDFAYTCELADRY